MMKGYIKNSIIALMIGLTATSCEDFLEQDDPNRVPATDFWTTMASADQGLTAVYAAMRNESILQTHYEAFRADMAWPGNGRPTPSATSNNEYNCYAHTYTESTAFINEKWEGCYAGIYRANQVIRALNNIKDDVDLDSSGKNWSETMAQARFFRGLLHFYLHSAFNEGKVMLVDEIPSTLGDFHRPLAEADEVQDFFRQDLLYAYENLPIEYNSLDDLGRVTKGAAATILGTSYLYEFSATGDKSLLDLAIPYFRFVINDCGYELMQSGDELFTEDNEMNKESIFEIAYSENFKPEMDAWDDNNFIQHVAMFGMGYNNGHVLPAWLANAYQTEPIDAKNPRNKYLQEHEDGTTTLETRTLMPLRASAMVALWEDVYTPWCTKACVPAVTNVNFSATMRGFGYYKKYSDTKTQPYKPNDQKSGMNIVVNRLPEVYLMLAEALIEKGDLDEATSLMNTLRERWGLVLLGSDKNDGFTYDNKPYTAESLMKQLREVDKPLECSIEGHMMRWIDLRRWGMLESNFKKLSDAKYYAVNSIVTSRENIEYSTNQFAVVRNQAEFNANPPGAYKIIDFEYDIPYVNYMRNRKNIDYYPIPLGEKEKNPNI